MQEDEILADILVKEAFCESIEEATATIVAIQSEGIEWQTGLEEYLGITTEEAKVILKQWRGEEEEDSDSESSQGDATPCPLQEENDDDGELIGEGECELCERDILLTRHHLIPKSTWPRIETRLMNAGVAKESGKIDQAEAILGDGLVHLLDSLTTDRREIRGALNRTCDICRPCHSMIHRAHDNMTLANDFNTIEKLLQDEKVYKFSRWASKQRTGKYSRR